MDNIADASRHLDPSLLMRAVGEAGLVDLLSVLARHRQLHRRELAADLLKHFLVAARHRRERQQAVDAGCAETVMLRDGFLTEGAAVTYANCKRAASG